MKNEISEPDYTRLLAEKILKQRGIQSMMYTKDCVLWKLQNEDCFGCTHKLPCDQVAGLTAVFVFSPISSLHSKVEEVLSANSFEEVIQLVSTSLDKWLATKLDQCSDDDPLMDDYF